MKASVAHGIRPSALVLGKDSKKPWTPTDILLAKSYQRFLEELCQQCGQPKYLCHNDDNDIDLKIKYDVCEATKKAERRQAEIAKDSKDNPVYGQRVYAAAELTEEAKERGAELSDYRRPYMIEQAKKAGHLPDDDAPSDSE